MFKLIIYIYIYIYSKLKHIYLRNIYNHYYDIYICIIVCEFIYKLFKLIYVCQKCRS